MKPPLIALLVVVAPMTFVVSMTVIAQNGSPQSGNGIALSEFKGYEAWQVIATSVAGNDGCGTSTVGCMKAIVGNTAMIKAYRDGIPENGRPFPDGAAMAKIEWLKESNPSSPYEVTVPGVNTEVAFMLKDSKRFRDTDGWGYATFQPVGKSGAFKAKTTDPTVAKTLCHTCHTNGANVRDFVYTDYAPR
jgi:Cytochrome P460